MSNVIAIVKTLVGQAEVISPEGIRRQLIEGDRLFKGDQLVTGPAASVSLALTEGGDVDVSASSQWSEPASSNAVQAATEPGSPSQEPSSAGELAQPMTADIDPTIALEAPAAGPAAAGGAGSVGGAHSFVLLDATGARLDPTVGFNTQGRSFTPFSDTPEDSTNVNLNPIVDASLTAEAFEDDKTFDLDLLAGTVDPDQNDTLSVSNVQGLVAGLTLNGNRLVIDPSDASFQSLAVGETRDITVTYDILDGNGGTVAQSATITIKGTNDAPTVVAQLSAGAIEDSANFSVNLLEGAADVDNGAVLNVSNVQGLVDGLTLNGNSLSVNPGHASFQNLAAGESRDIQVTFDVIDGLGGVTPQTLTVTITGTNDAPVGVADSITINEDSQAIGNVLSNDTDVDGPGLSVTQFSITGLPFTFAAGSTATIPFVGKLTIASTGDFTFTPNANYNGPVPQFSYTLSDGSLSDSSTLNISINAINDAPVNSLPNTLNVNEDGSLQLRFSNRISVSDVDNNNLSTTLSVEHGVLNLGSTFGITVTGNGTDSLTLSGNKALINLALNSLRYAPTADYNGDDTLTVSTSDGALTDVDSMVITVNPVNDAPTNAPVTLAAIPEDSGARLITQAELLANANDIDGPSLTATGLTITSGNGTLVDNGNGTWTYTPALNDDSSVSFSYSVTDGSLAVAGSATLDITPVNDAPVAGNDSITTDEDTPYSGNLLDNDSDVDGDALSVTQFSLTIAGFPIANYAAGSTANIPGVGRLTVAGNGDFTFTPNANYNGPVPQFSYTLSDGSLTDNASLSIDINAINDAPVNSVPGSQSLNEDGSRTFRFLNGNRISVGDIDSNNLSTTLSVEHGTLTLGSTLGVTVSGNGTGSVTLSGSQTAINLAMNGLRYVPTANYNGSDQLTIATTDGSLTDTDTVAITVNPVNDAPTNAQVTLSAIAEDSGARLITQAELLGNANDIDGPSLTATGLSIASGNGTLVDNLDGTWTYTPALNDDSNVSFNYSVTDGSLAVAGSATLDITPVNDAPTTAPVTLTAIVEDSGARLITQAELLANANDIDGPGLAATGLSIASGNGTLVDNLDGTWTYTPALNDDSDVSFSYSITDGSLAVAGSATLDITPVNDAAVITSTTVNLTESNTVLTTSGTLAINDVDGPAPSFVAQTNVTGSYGRFSVGTDGVWTYTTTSANNQFVAGQTYTDTLTVTSADGSTGTISVQILGSNDAPTLTGVRSSFNYSESTGSGIARTQLDSNVVLSDLDSSNFDGGSLTVTINNVVANQDQISVLNQGTANGQISVVGSDVRFNFGSGAVSIGSISGGTLGTPLTVSLNGNATPAAVDALVQRVAYGNASQLPDTTPRSITITVKDGDGTANGGTDSVSSTMTVNVISVNDAPTFSSLGGTRAFTEGGSAVVLDSNASLADRELAVNNNYGGATLTLARTGGANGDDDFRGTGSLTLSAGEVRLGGTLVGNYDQATLDAGTLQITFTNGTSNAQATSVLRQLSYANTSDAPPASVTINYVLNDGNTAGAQGTGGAKTASGAITVNITGTNDAPSITVTLVNNFTEDTPSNAVGSVVATYTTADAENNTVTVTLSDTTNYALDGAGNVTLTAAGLALVNSGQELPAFTLTPNDGTINGTPANVDPTVTPVNDAAILSSASVALTETDAPLSTGGQLTVTDVDSPATFVAQTNVAGTYGSFNLGTDGTWTYVANSAFNNLNVGQSVTDSFTVASADGTTSSVTVTINGSNDAPVAQTNSYSTNEDAPLTVTSANGVLANDTDVDTASANLSAELVSGTGPAHGSLTLNSDGSFSYTPTANWSGSDSFTYRTFDGSDYSAPVTVTLGVTPVADAPSLTLTDTALAAATDFQSAPLNGSSWSASINATSLNTGVGSNWNTSNPGGLLEVGTQSTYMGGSSTNQVIELERNTGDAANLFTDITAKAGSTYSLDFEYSPRAGQTNNSGIQVFWGGNLIGTLNAAAVGFQTFHYDLTAATDGTYRLEFKATDSNSMGGLLDNITLKNALNVGNEDSLIRLSSIDAQLVDTDTSETLSISIGDIPVGATIQDNAGNTFTATAGNTQADVTGWNLDNLSVLPPANFSGSFTLQVSATATESNGATASTTQSLAVTVNPVNDAPTIVVTQVNNFTEDAATNAVGSVVATYTTADAENSTVTVTLSDTTNYALNGTGGVTLTAAGLALINSGQELPAFTLTPTDGAINGVAASVDPIVTPVNDAPVITVTAAAALLENSATAGSTVATFIATDEEDGTPVVSFTPGSNDAGYYAISGTSVVLTATGATFVKDGGTLPTFSLTATDAGSMTAIGSATPSVTAQNDAPTITVTANDFTENSAAVGNVAATYVTADEDGNNLSVSFTGNSNANGYYVLANGRVELTTIGANFVNAGGSLPTVNLTVTDNGVGNLTGTGSDTPMVAPTADAPDVNITLGAAASTSTTINTGNVTSTNQGFTVSAFKLDGSAGTISINGSPQGFGVAGAASGADNELGQNGTSSEKISVVFTTAVDRAAVSFAWMNANERANYKLFDANGGEVGSGTLGGGKDGVDPAIQFTATNGVLFSRMEFTAPLGNDNDYLINSISFVSGNKYPVTITASPADFDFSESITGIDVYAPAGAILSAGTQNADGTWTLPLTSNGSYNVAVDPTTNAVTINGLEITVPSNIAGSPSLTVAATIVDGTDSVRAVTGTSADDSLTGTTGVDLLRGANGHDSLNGLGGNDRIDGGAGNDILIGDEGDDILMGGTGDDTLTGGTGADQFVWKAGNTGNDVIKDFNAAEGDRIDLHDLLQNEEFSSDITQYLRVDIATSTLEISSTGQFGSGGAADATIKLENAGAPLDLSSYGSTSSAIVNSLIAGADPLVKVDHS